MFLHTNNFFFSKSILISSLKRLWEKENDGSCYPLSREICVCRLQLETYLADALDMAGGVLVSLCICTISDKSVSTLPRYLEDQYMDPISQPSKTFWYLPGSRCWTKMRFTRAEKFLSPQLAAWDEFLYFLGNWGSLAWSFSRFQIGYGGWWLERRDFGVQGYWISKTYDQIYMTFLT